MRATASGIRSNLARAASILGACLGTGCIVEDGNRACGPNQVKASGEGARYCECAPGFVLDPKDDLGCVPCGENEEAVLGECQCVEGYSRPSAGAPCSTSSLGADCGPDAPCMGEFPLCSTRGYCTFEGCASSEGCMLPGWVCSEGVCEKPPDGYGKECASPADCAGSEATYCDTFRTHTCLVEGCGKGKPCPGDWSCCDLSPFAPMPICFEPKNLSNGNCPIGMLVNP